MLPMAAPDATDFYHTGPGTLAGRYLRRFWQPVARSVDVAVGRAVPVELLGERLTLYRGTSGTAHLLAERCAHRRTQLSLGWVEDDTLRCFYHGWRYDGAGQCVEQPAEAEGFAAKVRVGAWPVREYLGLVFAWLGDGEPPELPRQPEFEADGVLEVETFVRPCNYFNHIELDPLHIAFVHRESPEADAGLVGLPTIRATETEYGLVIQADRTTGEGPEATTRSQVQHRLMPNVSIFKVYPRSPSERAWRDRVAWRVPVHDEAYRSFVVDLVHADDGVPAKAPPGERADDAGLLDAVLRGRQTRQAAEAAASDVILLQDSLALVGQGPIAERRLERLGPSDVVPALIRRLWARELESLATGAPLTEWRRPANLPTNAGV